MENSIKVYRDKKGWSQEELGSRAGGIPQSAISAYENGEKQMMVETMMKIAKALGITPNKLLQKPNSDK